MYVCVYIHTHTHTHTYTYIYTYTYDRSVIDELARTLTARTLGPPPSEHNTADSDKAGSTQDSAVPHNTAGAVTDSHKRGDITGASERGVPRTAVSASRVPDAALRMGGLPGAGAFKSDVTDVTDVPDASAASAKARILQAIADRARV